MRAWFGTMTLGGGGAIKESTLYSDGTFLQKFYPERQPARDERDRSVSLGELAVRAGFAESEHEYRSKLHMFALELAEQQIKKAITRDQIIMQAVDAQDTLNSTINLLKERFEEWSFIKRSDCIERDDMEMLEELRGQLDSLTKERNRLEEYITENMHGTAPNITMIAGPVLGARIISIAGGLERLSRMPSSTIQVLGAGKALFKHLQKGTPPPKHGILYQHHVVQGAPWWQQGKLARAVSSSLAVAARLDYHGGGLNNDVIKKMDKKVERIKAAHTKPSKKQKK